MNRKGERGLKGGNGQSDDGRVERSSLETGQVVVQLGVVGGSDELEGREK